MFEGKKTPSLNSLNTLIKRYCLRSLGHREEIYTKGMARGLKDDKEEGENEDKDGG